MLGVPEADPRTGHDVVSASRGESRAGSMPSSHSPVRRMRATMLQMRTLGQQRLAAKVTRWAPTPPLTGCSFRWKACAAPLARKVPMLPGSDQALAWLYWHRAIGPTCPSATPIHAVDGRITRTSAAFNPRRFSSKERPGSKQIARRSSERFRIRFRFRAVIATTPKKSLQFLLASGLRADHTGVAEQHIWLQSGPMCGDAPPRSRSTGRREGKRPAPGDVIIRPGSVQRSRSPTGQRQSVS